MDEKKFILKYRQILENLFKGYKNQIKKKPTAVFLSGGIDSSLIGYFTSIFFKNTLFLTLTSKEGVDLEYVKILNNYLKQKLIIVNFDNQKINQIKNKVIEALEAKKISVNPTQLSLASAFYLLCEEASKNKIRFVFTGQGPDILLGGYHMYQKISIDKLNEKIKKDLNLLEVDKLRDQSMADIFGIKLINPYLEKEFIDFSLNLPADLKINKIENVVYEKYISRKLAQYLNLPREIIFRRKKALQYSTKIRKYL